MTRICYVFLLIAVVGVTKAQDKPNVVVMLSDNFGYGDIGIDTQTPVAADIGIGPEIRFTGKINKITPEVK